MDINFGWPKAVEKIESRRILTTPVAYYQPMQSNWTKSNAPPSNLSEKTKKHKHNHKTEAQMATTTATLYHQLPSDIRLATCTLFRSFNHRHLLIPQCAGASSRPYFSRSTTPFRLLAFSTNANEPFVEKVSDKPPICSADELHYVSVANCDWRLALWRYNPPPQVRFTS